MILVHHLENSRSQRVLWLLEELHLDYEVVRYKRNPKTLLAPPELRRVHPLGKSPVLEDEGMVLAESGAIVEYLVDRYGPHLAPQPGTPEWSRYLHWLHYAEGSAMPPLLLKLVLRRMGPFGLPARPYVDRQIRLHLDYMEGELARAGPWFVGEAFTAADILMSFPAEAASARAAPGQPRPHLKEFLRRAGQRPAFRIALERGGPYKLAR